MKKKTLLLALMVALGSLSGCKVSNSPELGGENSGTGTSANDSVASDGGKTSGSGTPDSTTRSTAESTQSTTDSDPQSAAESSDNGSVTFDGFKISVDPERTTNVLTIDNQFSDLNGRKVYAVPMTIENTGSVTKGINMFYVKPFGPSGMELDSVYAFFTEAQDFYKEMRPGAKMNTAYYILDDGSGEYCIVFQSFSEEKELKINLG